MKLPDKREVGSQLYPGPYHSTKCPALVYAGAGFLQLTRKTDLLSIMLSIVLSIRYRGSVARR